MSPEHRLTILNVDDRESSRYVRARTLRQAGFEIRDAAAGHQALALIEADPPDLVLLDVNLPDISGFEVCRRIKSDVRTREIPVIQISAELRDDSSRVAGLEGGADVYLVEPVTPELLVSTIKALLRAEQARQALRESERKYRALFESMQEGFAVGKIVCDPAGKCTDWLYLDVNPAFESIFGRTRDQLIGRTYREAFPDAQWEYWVAELGQVALTGNPAHLEQYDYSRGQHFQGIAYSPRIGQFAAIFTDITERKRAEQALQQSEERYRTLFTSMSEGFALGEAIYDENGSPLDFRFIEVNEAFERETGLARDILGRSMREVLPELEAVWIDRYCRVAVTGEPIRFEQYNRDTDRHYSVFCYSPSRGRFAILFRDITEMKRTEEALRDRERQFRELADSMPQLVWITDAAGYVLFFNRKWQEQLGVPLEQLLGYKWAEVLHPEDRDRTLSFWHDCLQTGEHYEVEYRFRTARGDYRWFLARGVPISDEQGRITRWFGTCTDIEDSKRAEERLRQSQKLESIGLIAGGIAHDFNNLLAGIMGNASLAGDMLPAEHPVSDLLGRVVKISGHAAHLVQQLLAYSGKGRFVIEPVNLSELVGEISTLLQPSVSKKITLQLDLERELPQVEADRSQMQQIITNLVLNASEAMGDRAGLISIRTGFEEVDEARRRREPEYADLAPGRYVFLQVEDTGPGMDEPTRAKIFDPFFTTKFTGRGLGLAAVSGIVRGHKGSIQVSTAAGEGTCFKVLLPAASTALKLPRPVIPEEEQLRGSGTVLVVDDEEDVRQIAKKALERYGYEVLLAHDGPSAIELFKTAANLVSVVVLDLSMPGMSGQEALPAIQKIRPDVEVLISSGYSEDEVLGKFAGARVAGFIQKPYTARQLAAKVYEVTPRSA